MTRPEKLTFAVLTLLACNALALCALYAHCTGLARHNAAIAHDVALLQEEVLVQRVAVNTLERVRVDVLWHVECDDADDEVNK